jgi:hypothetical protein
MEINKSEEPVPEPVPAHMRKITYIETTMKCFNSHELTMPVYHKWAYL